MRVEGVRANVRNGRAKILSKNANVSTPSKKAIFRKFNYFFISKGGGWRAKKNIRNGNNFVQNANVPTKNGLSLEINKNLVKIRGWHRVLEDDKGCHETKKKISNFHQLLKKLFYHFAFCSQPGSFEMPKEAKECFLLACRSFWTTLRLF